MKESKKIKFKNAAEIVVATPVKIAALASVSAALAPIVGGIRAAQTLQDAKRANSETTKEDIIEALRVYGSALLAPVRAVKYSITTTLDNIDERNSEFDKVKKLKQEQIAKEQRRIATEKQRQKDFSAETLKANGVADLIKLIQNAPSISIKEQYPFKSRYLYIPGDRKEYFNNSSMSIIYIGGIQIIKIDDDHSIDVYLGEIKEGKEQKEVLVNYLANIKQMAKKLILPKTKLLTVDTLYWDLIRKEANNRIAELKQQDYEASVSAFSDEVAKRIGNSRQ